MDNEIIRGGQENILPEAANLFYALRSMGYENTAAVADLLDNSIDAHANNVWISIDDDLSKIIIADDGSGMSDETLRTAIKLGGKKVHDTSSDLGKYGLGLITASLSMGKTLRIITKQDGEYNTAILSYDEIQRTNMFSADFHKSLGTEKMSFDHRTHSAESGTVLIIDDCDKIQYKTAQGFSNDLYQNISEVFRHFITNGTHIFINQDEVKAADPFYRKYDGTKILCETDIEIKKPDNTIGKMHVMAVQVNDFGVAMNKKLKINIYRQGFYIIRNGREIAAALEYPEVYKKHNDLNLLRIELSFSSDLDDMMGINLKKHDIAPTQEIVNLLRNVLNEPIKKFREKQVEIQRTGVRKNPFAQPAVGQKPNTGTTSTTSPSTVSGTATVNGVDTQPATAIKDYTFNFSTFAGAEDDPLFKVSSYEGTISIRYNVKNVFYLHNFTASQEGSEKKEFMDKVIEASLKSFLSVNGEVKLEDYSVALAKNILNKD